MSDGRQQTEQAVLATYRRENPSTHFLAESDEAFEKRRRDRAALFRDQLKFPPRMFAGADLLDLGAGTGENTLYYALWGARCTLVEMNDEALARARSIFEKRLPSPEGHDFVVSSLFAFESDRRFDLVTCEGVIHHTADKRGAFSHAGSFLKPGGTLVLSVGNAAGCFQRSLQRAILYRFAGNDEEIVAVAERLFREHIDRAERHGQRSRRAIVFDSFVNPKVDFPLAEEVLGWFAEEGLKLYSTWPPILPAALGDSGMRATFDPLALPEIAAQAQAVWLAHDADDAEEVPSRLAGLGALSTHLGALASHVNDFQPGQDFGASAFLELAAATRAAVMAYDPWAGFAAKTAALLDEVETVVKLMEAGDLAGLERALPATRHLFRGTGGLGISRYLGYRPEET